MQDLREIHNLLTDAKMIEEKILAQTRSRKEEESLSSILGAVEEAPNEPQEHAYLKVFLLKISRDIHTIKICQLLFAYSRP